MQKKMGHDPKVIKKEDSARILLLDIETAPMEVYVWQLFKNNYISPDAVIKDWSVLTWSAKWLFEPEVVSAKVTGEQAINREDREIMNDLWLLLDEANIVIAHNGKRFDVRKCNARFALNGLTPPLPYRVIDTLQVSRQNFALSSYKLDYINKLFGLAQKGHPGFDVWKRSVRGDEEALEEMRSYCDNDVIILEDLYLQIRPWVKGHPNVGLYIDSETTVCTNCGNEDLEWGGSYFTPAGRYKAFRCNACGAIGRSRSSDLTPEERETLCLSTVA
jgi:DNA polymerase elongation subunit (family B)